MFRSFVITILIIFSNYSYAYNQDNGIATWYFLIDIAQTNPSVSLISQDYETIRSKWVKGNEIIAVHEGLLVGKVAEPKFDKLVNNAGRTLETKNIDGETNCAYGLDALNKISNTYRLCTSSFIKEKLVGSFFQNTVGAIATLGTSIGHTVAYDPIKFNQLMESDAVKSSIDQTIYKTDVEYVENHPTSLNYQSFINKYKNANYDPDMMVNTFSSELPKIQANEANAVEMQRISERNSAIAEQNRQKAIAEEQAKAASKFRKMIKVGDNTNCGLVVTVQESIVQVQTQKDLRWMKRDQILPSGFSGYCD